MKQALAIVLVLLVYCLQGFLSPVRAQSGNVIVDGGFENGTSSWAWYSNGTAAFDAPSPGYTGSYQGRVSMGSDMGTNVQLNQYGLSIKADTVYTLTFTAYSSMGGSILVDLLKHTSPYTNYGLYQEVTLSTGWQTYQFNFTTSGFSGVTTDVRFRFWFPWYSSNYETVYFDDVSLCKAVAATAPLAPLLADPDSAATGVTANPTLSWNASGGASSYEIQIARTSSFGSTIVSSQAGITDTWYEAGGLGNDTTYYWHVRATNSAGTSSWSNAWRFTVHVDPPPTPVLSTPANQATNISTNPSFTWEASEGATSYHLQVSLMSTFSTLAVDQTEISETSFDASTLLSDTVYYWRLRASNAAGNSSWSSTRNFRTAGSGGVNILTNWSFEDGTSSWSWWDPSYGSLSTGDPAPGSGAAGGLVTIYSTEGGNLQLNQTGMVLSPNTNYTLKFYGYSSSGHDMGVYLHQHSAPYTNFNLSWTPELTTTWQAFDMPIETPAFFDPPQDTASTTDTRLRFWFADDAAGGDVYHLDSVSLSRTTAETTPIQLQAVAIVAEGRESVNDDEMVLLNASGSTGPIGPYYWSVDGTALGEGESLERYLPLGANERSKLVTVRLVVFDEEKEHESQTEVVIRVTRRPKAYFYLTDHLGTIRSTVRGGRVMVDAGFAYGLSGWDLYGPIASGWSCNNGVLVCNSYDTPVPRIQVNSSPIQFNDGIMTVDVKKATGVSMEWGGVIVRFQNPANFYLIKPAGYHLKIYEKLNDVLYERSSALLPGGETIDTTWYRLQITAEGGTLVVHWNGQYVTQWTDATPWESGKIGFWHDGVAEVKWKDVRATTDAPGQVIAAEDFDPWGLVLEGRSYVDGAPDQRYKFTGKERDAETGDAANQGYDYFGARYYDARIGRFLSVDRFSSMYPGLSPYCYAANNPMRFVDINGDTITVFDGEERVLYSVGMEYTGKSGSIAAIVSALNRMATVAAGKSLLAELMNADAGYNYSQGALDVAGTFHAKGYTEYGGSITLNSMDFGTVAHESFHAYEHQMNNGGASITSETQAFAFERILSNAVGEPGPQFGRLDLNRRLTYWGLAFEDDMRSYMKSFEDVKLTDAASRFVSGSQMNAKGHYNNFPFSLKHQVNLLRTLFGRR